MLNSLGTRLTVRFGGLERFWRLRRTVRRVYFATAGRLFAARYAATEAVTNASALRYLLANTAASVLLACALISLFAVLAGQGDDLAHSLGLGPLSHDTYAVLLESVAAVTGVFLALYFTAVSAVAATVYSSVPHDIRTLIVRDRLGNVYVRVVAFTMALSVLLLVIDAASSTAYRLATPVIGVLAVFSIFAFIRLGQRAFYLADPTRLADTLVDDFESWEKRAKYGGWRWDVPAFQAHYGAQARRSASSLAGLLRIASRESHLRGNSLRLLIGKTSALLIRYLDTCHRIPTRSRWFGDRYEHQQWYLADSTAVQMATSTASALQPKVVPDTTWVEEALLRPVVDSVQEDLSKGEFENAYLSMQPLTVLWERFGSSWSCREGIRWVEAVTEVALSGLTDEGAATKSRSPLFVGVADTVAMLPMSVELGFNRVLDDLNIADLGKRISTADWGDERTPYEFTLSVEVRRALEDAQAGVAFERAAAAPSMTRTPGWYIEEVALNAFERNLKVEVDAIIDHVCVWYPVAADRLTEAKKLDAAAAVLSRGIEVVWKLERHLERWESLVEDVRREGERVDFKRPEWDWSAYRAKVAELRVSVLEHLARSIPMLAAQERKDDLPDFFGHAVHRAGEACFDAMARNDPDLFEKLFPTYLVGTLLASERVRDQTVGFFPEQAITWTFEPVLDALDISGYALLYSELHGNSGFWDLCRTQWEKYLDDEHGDERLRWIAALSAFQQGQLAIAPRALLRTRWQMAFSNALEQLPRDDSARLDHPFGERPVRHDSALIRRIAPGEGMLGASVLHNASDAFMTLFLAKKPGAEDLDFGVADWVERELTDVAPEQANQPDQKPEESSSE